MIRSLDTRLITMGFTLCLCSLNRLELSGSKRTSASESVTQCRRSHFVSLSIRRQTTLIILLSSDNFSKPLAFLGGLISFPRPSREYAMPSANLGSVPVCPAVAFLLFPLRDAFGRLIPDKTALHIQASAREVSAVWTNFS
jgi:hypothetical protein